MQSTLADAFFSELNDLEEEDEMETPMEKDSFNLVNEGNDEKMEEEGDEDDFDLDSDENVHYCIQ